MSVRDNAGGGGKTEFRWSVYGLSGHMNVKNSGSVTFEVVDYIQSGTVKVYGTDNPNNITHISNVTLLGSFLINSKGKKETIETDKKYPYLVLYPVYAESWSGGEANLVKITI